MATRDKGLLEAALIGYHAQLEKIHGAMAEIKQQLGGGWVSSGKPTKPTKAADADPAVTPPKKRTMSAAARKRIAEAQKKRWAEFHAKKGE